MKTNIQASKQLLETIQKLGKSLHFFAVGIANGELENQENPLRKWLEEGYQAGMTFFHRSFEKRLHPLEGLPEGKSIICVSMNYWQDHQTPVARFALGRDYHDVMRQRLQQFVEQLQALIGPFRSRIFVDSSPVMEKALAAKAGLGWIGKNTLLIAPKKGSWCCLGGVVTDLALPETPFVKSRCGTCQRCVQRCPTQALVAPYVLDARRCISYLTIEHKGSIPEELRSKIGTRIFGCDECQVVCPWNRWAKNTLEQDFKVRTAFKKMGLVEMFLWTQEEFLKHTEGSAIRRLGYERWLRNLAIALGNSSKSAHALSALKMRKKEASDLVKEHIRWAIDCLHQE